jgi:hypothetical protein
MSGYSRYAEFQANMNAAEKAYTDAAWQALDTHTYDVDLANDVFERQIQHSKRKRKARKAALRSAEAAYRTAMARARDAWHTAHDAASTALGESDVTTTARN